MASIGAGLIAIDAPVGDGSYKTQSQNLAEPSRPAGPGWSRVSTGLLLPDGGADYLHRLRLAILAAPQLEGEGLANHGPRSVTSKGADVNEDF